MRLQKEFLKEHLLILSLLFLSPILIHAKSGGGTAATFLQIDPGARSASMASAQVAMTEGLDAANWNSGVLGNFKRNEVTLSYLRYYEGISFTNAAFGIPTQNLGTMGFSFSMLDSGTVQKVDERGMVTGGYTTKDMAVGPAWGFKFSEKIAFGSSFKYINQSVDDVSATGFAFDVGGILSIKEYNSTLGVSAKNLGTNIQGRPLPSAFLFGVGYQPVPLPNLTVSGQADYALKGPAVGRLGIEYKAMGVLPFRVGYKISKDNLNTLNFGTRLALHKSMLFDYSIGLDKDIGNIHFISLTYRFGEKPLTFSWEK